MSNWLAKTCCLTPVWSAVPADVAFAQQVAAHARSPAVNLAGAVSIHQLATALRGARLLISVDTGVVHLAAAVGTPCVSLHFRKDYPASRWHAWQVPTQTVTPDTYCPECPQERCRLETLECVRSISVEQVIEATNELLKTCSDARMPGSHSAPLTF